MIVAHDAAGLAQDELDGARIFFPSLGEAVCECGRLDVLEMDGAAFGFRDDLLAAYDDIAGFGFDTGRIESRGDERGEIVAGLDHRDSFDRGDCYRSHRGKPTIPKGR